MSEAPTPVMVAAASTPPPKPWWLPEWPQVLATGLFAMTWWIFYILSPAKAAKPSELFNMLAQALVLTALTGGVVGAVYTVSRDSQKKNEIIAAQAQAIASQTSGPPPT